jgi:hypothetical protein
MNPENLELLRLIFKVFLCLVASLGLYIAISDWFRWFK